MVVAKRKGGNLGCQTQHKHLFLLNTSRYLKHFNLLNFWISKSCSELLTVMLSQRFVMKNKVFGV